MVRFSTTMPLDPMTRDRPVDADELAEAKESANHAGLFERHKQQ